MKQDIPESLKKYELRVSAPHGIFPDDVANLVLQLEAKLEEYTNKINYLNYNNKDLTEKLQKAQQELADVKTAYTRLKYDLSLNVLEPTTEKDEVITLFNSVASLNKNKLVIVSDE